MMMDLESDLVERKESLKGNAPTKIREAVCALANELPDPRCSGVVFVGVRDDGTPTGMSITDELLRTLADVKTDGNTVPPTTLTLAKRNLGGVEVAVLTVRPSEGGRWRNRRSCQSRSGLLLRLSRSGSGNRQADGNRCAMTSG